MRRRPLRTCGGDGREGRARRFGRALPLAVALATSVPTGGCADLLFRNDHRLTITSPAANARVDVPLRVTWVARDFTPGRDGSFAVFLDRDPQPPGETLAQFGGKPFDIFTADQAGITLDHVIPHSAADRFERNHHDLTVILLDPQGRRIGETAGYVEVDVNGD